MRKHVLASAVAVLALSVAACADEKKPDAKPGDTKPADAKPAGTKPADTKPVDTRPVDAVDKPRTVAFASPPADWTEEKDRWRLPSADGDTAGATVRTFSLPYPRPAGGTHGFVQVLSTWKECFDGAAGGPTGELDANGLLVRLADLSGTRRGGTRTTPTTTPGQKLVGCFIEGPDASWCACLEGDERSVDKNREAFLAFVKTAHAVARPVELHLEYSYSTEDTYERVVIDDHDVSYTSVDDARRYVRATPRSGGPSYSPSDLVTKRAVLTDAELRSWIQLIETSKFLDLEASYGKTGERAYPHTITVSLHGTEKKVTFLSTISPDPEPPAFSQVEERVRELEKKKF